MESPERPQAQAFSGAEAAAVNLPQAEMICGSSRIALISQ